MKQQRIEPGDSISPWDNQWQQVKILFFKADQNIRKCVVSSSSRPIYDQDGKIAEGERSPVAKNGSHQPESKHVNCSCAISSVGENLAEEEKKKEMPKMRRKQVLMLGMNRQHANAIRPAQQTATHVLLQERCLGYQLVFQICSDGRRHEGRGSVEFVMRKYEELCRDWGEMVVREEFGDFLTQTITPSDEDQQSQNVASCHGDAQKPKSIRMNTKTSFPASGCHLMEVLSRRLALLRRAIKLVFLPLEQFQPGFCMQVLRRICVEEFGKILEVCLQEILQLLENDGQQRRGCCGEQAQHWSPSSPVSSCGVSSAFFEHFDAVHSFPLSIEHSSVIISMADDFGFRQQLTEFTEKLTCVCQQAALMKRSQLFQLFASQISSSIGSSSLGHQSALISACHETIRTFQSYVFYIQELARILLATSEQRASYVEKQVIEAFLLDESKGNRHNSGVDAADCTRKQQKQELLSLLLSTLLAPCVSWTRNNLAARSYEGESLLKALENISPSSAHHSLLNDVANPHCPGLPSMIVNSFRILLNLYTPYWSRASTVTKSNLCGAEEFFSSAFSQAFTELLQKEYGSFSIARSNTALLGTNQNVRRADIASGSPASVVVDSDRLLVDELLFIRRNWEEFVDCITGGHQYSHNPPHQHPLPKLAQKLSLGRTIITSLTLLIKNKEKAVIEALIHSFHVFVSSPEEISMVGVTISTSDASMHPSDNNKLSALLELVKLLPNKDRFVRMYQGRMASRLILGAIGGVTGSGSSAIGCSTLEGERDIVQLLVSALGSAVVSPLLGLLTDVQRGKEDALRLQEQQTSMSDQVSTNVSLSLCVLVKSLWSNYFDVNAGLYNSQELMRILQLGGDTQSEEVFTLGVENLSVPSLGRSILQMFHSYEELHPNRRLQWSVNHGSVTVNVYRPKRVEKAEEVKSTTSDLCVSIQCPPLVLPLLEYCNQKWLTSLTSYLLLSEFESQWNNALSSSPMNAATRQALSNFLHRLALVHVLKEESPEDKAGHPRYFVDDTTPVRHRRLRLLPQASDGVPVKGTCSSMTKENNSRAEAARQATEEETSALELTRQKVVEAAIVRVMKARHILAHQTLFAEVAKQVRPHFSMEMQRFKAAVTELIDREYIERREEVVEGEGRHCYSYVA